MISFNEATESAIVFIFDASLRATLVLLVVIFVGWSLRSASASARRLVWIGGLSASLSVPVMMLVGPAFPVAVLGEVDSQDDELALNNQHSDAHFQADHHRPASVASELAVNVGDFDTSIRSAESELAELPFTGASELTKAARERRSKANQSPILMPHWQSLISAVLALGIAVQIIRMIVSSLRVRRLVRSCGDNTPQAWAIDWQEARRTMLVGDSVSLKETVADVSPLACGVIRRTVLLPATAHDWEQSRRRAVMLHELGHVRQRDVAAILLGQLVTAVYFFHPLAWFVARRLRHDCERACDDLVLNAGQKPVDYARHLTEIARSFSTSRHRNALAMAMSRSSNIESRVTAILDSDTPRNSAGAMARRSALAMALLLGALVAAPQASNSQTESDSPPPTAASAVTNGSQNSPTPAAADDATSVPERPSPGTDNNNAFTAQDAPASWDVRKGENILWSAKLGSQTYGSPVVSGGRVFIGTNNASGYLKEYPATKDMGCLLALGVQSGELLWQYSAEKLPTGRVNDWPLRGISASPFVRGDRLWIVNNRSEVVCMDTEGFYDGEDDGPVDDGSNGNRTQPDGAVSQHADVVWTVDLIDELGSFPHNHSDCTITSDGKLLFIVVPNGTDHTHLKESSADAPSFVALDARSGAIVWTSRDTDNHILHGQWSSAAYGEFDGVRQVICPSGSGWLFGLEAATGKTLWKFDCNPKFAQWKLGSRGRRNNLVAKPLIYDGRVYMATGQDPEHGEGHADLWCIDPTKRGDVSTLLPGRSRFVPNPDTALVWHFDQVKSAPGGKPGFEDFFHRSVCTPVAKDGLLIAPDTSGLVHCFDAKTGQRFWTHDLFAACLSSPIVINDYVYIGDEDGDVAILTLSKQLDVVAEISLGEAILTTPTIADGVLFQATRSRLFAIKPGASSSKVAAATTEVKPGPDNIQQQIKQLTAALDFARKQEAKLAEDRAKLEQLQKSLRARLESLQNSNSKGTN